MLIVTHEMAFAAEVSTPRRVPARRAHRGGRPAHADLPRPRHGALPAVRAAAPEPVGAPMPMRPRSTPPPARRSLHVCAASAPTRPACTGRPIRRSTCESRHWLAGRMQRGRAGGGDRRHRQRDRPRSRRRAAPAAGQPHRDPAAGRLAGWRARGDLRAGGRPRAARAGRARRVDVASWADEEGHYASFPGSRSFIGDFADAEIDAAQRPPRGPQHARGAGRGRPGRHGRAPASIRAATAAISRRISSRATSWRRKGAAHRHRHQHRRHLAVPHRLRGRAEPCRHHAHGDPPRCRAGAGEAGRRDRPPRSRKSAPRARCGPPAASRWTPARPASSPAARKCCSSSATPIPPCSPAWRPRCRSWWREVERRPLPHHAARAVAFDAQA